MILWCCVVKSPVSGSDSLSHSMMGVYCSLMSPSLSEHPGCLQTQNTNQIILPISASVDHLTRYKQHRKGKCNL